MMTAPWLAPDGREFGARCRPIRTPFVPASLRDLVTDAGQFVRARRTPVARACRPGWVGGHGARIHISEGDGYAGPITQ